LSLKYVFVVGFHDSGFHTAGAVVTQRTRRENFRLYWFDFWVSRSGRNGLSEKFFRCGALRFFLCDRRVKTLHSLKFIRYSMYPVL